MAKKNEIVKEKRPVQEIRAEIRDYIRNERDTILKKWMALNESVKSEDYHRSQFMERKHREDIKALPVNILKFIGTIKRAVRNTMRHKGGTTYSIVRSMFLYWDADKSGQMSANELLACMKSLGIKITYDECAEIVDYYKTSGDEMDYRQLLQDIQAGEPSVIAFVSQSEDEQRDHQEIHFEEIKDKFVKMPSIVKKFLDAVGVYLAAQLRNQGGTPDQHIRFLFQFYDFDYSSGLQPSELQMACRRKMKLQITDAQAEEIVAYYDRKGTGEVYFEKFLEDVCIDVKPVLSFAELTPRGIEQKKKVLEANPFIPKPFAAPANKILEKFKQDVKVALVNKVNKQGGSVASWIRDAFVFWDPKYTRKISDAEHLIGAAKRLGVTISENEARVLMRCYDRYNTGDMHYEYLAKEIMEEDCHFLMDSKIVDTSVTPTSRTPPVVLHCLQKIRQAVDAFVRKSKGHLQPRDVFHGTCLRFDAARSGRLDIHNFRHVVRELRVHLHESQLAECFHWFDSNGSPLLDYDAMCDQMYGADVVTEKLTLPRIRESSNHAELVQSASKSLKSSLSMSNVSDPEGTQFGVAQATLERNMDVVESQAAKLARSKQKRLKILGEKSRVIRKLAEIEEQRKRIIEDYKASKAAGKSSSL